MPGIRSSVALFPLAVVLGLSVAVASCALGQRPTLQTTPTAEGTMTGDAAIDAVLAALDTVDGATFTAEYSTTQLFGGTTVPAIVTQVGTALRRSVTIGQVRFITDASTTRTCILDTGVCNNGLLAQAVSNTGLTHEFTFGDMAKRLRRDAVAKSGPSIGSTVDIQGMPATCVDVIVTGGVKRYCAFANGVLATFIGADVTVEVTAYRAEPDETLFAA